MPLIENTLFGERDKIQTAISRLQKMSCLAEIRPFYVADSGGKDSTVIKHICLFANLPFEIFHSHTTCDHPQTVYFVRKEKDYWNALGINYTIEYSEKSMWQLIAKKGLPTRIRRWCCEYLKEGGGTGRTVITGVRADESVKRSKRKAYETITKNGKKKFLTYDDSEFRDELEKQQCYSKSVINPIIDWTEADVWEFIRKYKLPYNPLYDNGYKRVGCVGCPTSSKQKQELNANPKYKEMYIGAISKYLQNTTHSNPFKNATEMYDWWVSGKAMKSDLQISLLDD